MLSSLTHLLPRGEESQPDPEDIFTSSLGLVFTDDAQNFYGDRDNLVAYHSRSFDKDFTLATADPTGETERRKFAHYVWNSSLLMAELLGGKPGGVEWRSQTPQSAQQKSEDQWWLSENEQQSWAVNGERVLELGAGAGLASLISVFAGAQEVTISDYPAATILESLRSNVDANIPFDMRDAVGIQGHLWGDCSSEFAVSHAHQFTRILAADCLWMADEHENLLSSMDHFLSRDDTAQIMLIAGFHTGRSKVAAFFDTVNASAELGADSIWECDTNGKRRAWDPERDEENAGERKKWLVVAIIKRNVKHTDDPSTANTIERQQI